MYFKVVTAILIKIAVAVFVPTANATPNTDKIVKQPVIRVEQINLEGNTVFDSELEAIVAPLEQKELIPEQIFELRDKLTNYYLSQGYANSGAFLPQQNLTDGKITIVIIEGTLASIEIKGLSSLDEDYIKSRLPEIKKPLNKIKLSQSLARLQKNPLIDNITAEIVPHSIGKNTLLLEIEENNPITATLNLTDAYSPSIGNFGGNAGITHNNLLGFGDRLNLNRSQTEGLTRTGGFYSLPLNKSDSRITFEYNVANNEIIERELRDLEIQADYESFALNFSQPLIVTRDEEFILDIGIESINSETFILEDLSFAFTLEFRLTPPPPTLSSN